MSLINPSDSIERQNEKLLLISKVLMRRVEQKNEHSGLAYAQFERAALLDMQVKERTIDLERTLDLLQESNAQLEEANRETEIVRTNLGEAIETINEGFALFDSDDLLVLFNSRFCRDMKDVEARLVEGLAFHDYVDLVSQSEYLALPPDVTPEKWAARRSKRHRDNHVVFNVSLKHDRWIQVSEHRTARGGTVILQTDVTEIIRLERKEQDRMRDRQAQILQATLDHLNQGVCIFDHAKKLVGWNKKMDQLLDLPPQEAALGRNFIILLEQLEKQLTFSDRFDVDMLIRWANHNEGRSPILFEVTRNGRQTFSVFGQEMPDRGFVMSFTDVTAERAAAKSLSEMNEMLEKRVQDRTNELGIALSEAERANASKSRFVAAASHDLLQPLSAAKLFVASVADRLTQPDLLNVIGKAESALISVEKIIEALLDISKLDATSPTFDIQPVRLDAILAPLSDELTPVARDKGLDLTIVRSGLTVRSDPGYLRRIIQNLITNAIRYTQTGKVLVGVRRHGAMARLEIWDTGCGIAEADQELIFQEFKRLDMANTASGLGLGLAIVDRACKSLNHPLHLCSIPDKGSCFTVGLKILCNDKVHEKTTRPISDSSRLPKQGQIVLLVENDADLANAITLMIEGWGAHVIHAVDGEDALAILEDIDLVPDVLLLDCQLGDGMSGPELQGRIVQQYGQIPTRMISADRGTALAQLCKQMGFSLMPKPIDRLKLFDFLAGVS
jgi:signal transduction histidine kinase